MLIGASRGPWGRSLRVCVLPITWKTTATGGGSQQQDVDRLEAVRTPSQTSAARVPRTLTSAGFTCSLIYLPVFDMEYWRVYADILATCEGDREIGGSSALLAVQEVGRAKPGWHAKTLENEGLLSHRHEDAWRGTGVVYQSDQWTIMRKRASKAGNWFRLTHLDSSRETGLAASTSHLVLPFLNVKSCSGITSRLFLPVLSGVSWWGLQRSSEMA